MAVSKHLVIHVKNHSWNKCDVCTPGKLEFICSTQLRMHLITHMEGKPYHYTICGKSFSNCKHFVMQMKNPSLNKYDICTSGIFELTCLTPLRMHLINHMCTVHEHVHVHCPWKELMSQIQ